MVKLGASRDILLQTPDIEAAASHYMRHFAFTEFMRTPNMIGLECGGLRLFLDRRQSLGPVLEFFSPDVESAKRALVEAGAVVIEETPSLPRLYLRDQFGLIYNLAKA